MDDELREKVKSLIQGQDTCVLATASGNRPHCSLMAYVANASCNKIYLMTFKDSRKYQNLRENPLVSLLIDTRQDTSKSDHSETIALTLSGRFQPILEETERKRISKELSRRHPELKDLFENPEGEPMRIIIESFLLLEGPTKAVYRTISEM